MKSFLTASLIKGLGNRPAQPSFGRAEQTGPVWTDRRS